MKIGCEDHLLVKWLMFTDEQIERMHSYALSFWKIWKPVVEHLHKVHFGETINYENTTTQ